MSMIPRHIHTVVEWHLRNANCIRANAFAEAEALRQKAETKSPAPEVPIKGKGGHGDQVARKAQLLAEAAKILEDVPVWAGVVEETREFYAGVPSMAEFYRLYYSIGLDFPYIAQTMGKEKTTLYNWRDKIVTRAALIAMEKGLITMQKNTD